MGTAPAAANAPPTGTPRQPDAKVKGEPSLPSIWKDIHTHGLIAGTAIALALLGAAVGTTHRFLKGLAVGLGAALLLVGAREHVARALHSCLGFLDRFAPKKEQPWKTIEDPSKRAAVFWNYITRMDKKTVWEVMRLGAKAYVQLADAEAAYYLEHKKADDTPDAAFAEGRIGEDCFDTLNIREFLAFLTGWKRGHGGREPEGDEIDEMLAEAKRTLRPAVLRHVRRAAGLPDVAEEQSEAPAHAAAAGA